MVSLLMLLQLLGFNCLRIPFSFQDLMFLAPNPFAKGCYPNSTDEIRASVTPPSASISPLTPLPSQARLCCLQLGLADFAFDFKGPSSTAHAFGSTNRHAHAGLV